MAKRTLLGNVHNGQYRTYTHIAAIPSSSDVPKGLKCVAITGSSIVFCIRQFNSELKWLRVRLTGKVLTALRKLPESARSSYAECKTALKKRFDPDSKRELHVAELHTRTRGKTEDWASFGDALRVLVDKAYPHFEGAARECLAVNQFLSQIHNQQVAFGKAEET